jgi:hypothetical protein
MDWQQLVALAVVGVTAGLFAWNRFRPRKFRFERDTHCGCGCAAGARGPQHSVVYHTRKGERPEVIVKMK